MTGGNGGIGSAIREKFQKEGHEVISPSSKELDLNNSKDIQTYFQKNGNIYGDKLGGYDYGFKKC